jgi:hypothetical protein
VSFTDEDDEEASEELDFVQPEPLPESKLQQSMPADSVHVPFSNLHSSQNTFVVNEK